MLLGLMNYQYDGSQCTSGSIQGYILPSYLLPGSTWRGGTQEKKHTYYDEHEPFFEMMEYVGVYLVNGAGAFLLPARGRKTLSWRC